MKKEVDSKKLLFENMSKLNPDFKLNEGDDKWIQKAVDPDHKGYCTPMTKPTCTPQRKALAKRFKKGIENESLNLNMLFPTNEYKKKANEIKAVIDKLVFDEDDEALDTLYRLLVRRTKPIANPQELKEIFDKFEKYAH
jgi:hypothetical protein